MINFRYTNIPIIIVGAPRSGSKMLRELLKHHPMITGPLYEKERIWCYGNKNKVGKAINVSDLSPIIKSYIRDHFKKESQKNPGMIIVDKSVNNSLRIDFVHEIFPESPIIHIVRDGRDAACSIRDRWKQPADLKYIIRNKAFPLKELPYFLQRQLRWYIEKLLSKKNHVNWWGPKLDDMQEILKMYSLVEIAGIQWSRCTEATLSSLSKLNNKTYIQVKYEDILLDTATTMIRLFNFIKIPVDIGLLEKCNNYIKTSSVGRWRKELQESEINSLMLHINNMLLKTGYLNKS